LNGVWRENGSEIHFGGEGSWTINAKALRRDRNTFWEEPAGYIAQYSFYVSLELENPTLDIAGLFGQDVPAYVTDAVVQQITNEIWNVYARDLDQDMFLALLGYLQDKFQVNDGI